ncbi:MAG TPA: MEDS domain-containing protein [Burkholderiales bacterium]|nr:MEDS domain-containing protein [Burkholderiales bacterium]
MSPGEVPCGTHTCHVYRTRAELLATLVPFFAAGLRANERCAWLTSGPLTEGLARSALARAGVDVDEAAHSGQLSVVPHAEWYFKKEHLTVDRLADLWLLEEEKALDLGYSGLRVSGNVSPTQARGWKASLHHEEVTQRAFRGRHIVALCSYAREKCGASEVFELARRHSHVLT